MPSKHKSLSRKSRGSRKSHKGSRRSHKSSDNVRKENEKKAIKFVKATHTCDTTNLNDILSDKAVWDIPGKSIVSGPANGIRQILHRCKLIRDYGVTLNIERILHGSSTDTIAFELHNTGTKGKGKRKEDIFDEHLTQVYHFGKSGKIVKIINYIEDVKMINRYFK